MTVTLTPCDALGVACTIAAHDHRDENEAPMFCNDCGAPTHYNEEVEDYFHDSEPACFLAYAPEWTDLVGTVMSGPTRIAGDTWTGVFDGVRPSEHDGALMAYFVNGRIGATQQTIFGFPLSDMTGRWNA